MGIVKVTPPRENLVLDPGLLHKSLQSICYELNRDLIADINFPVISLKGGASPTPTVYDGGLIEYAGFPHTVDKLAPGFLEFPHGGTFIRSEVSGTPYRIRIQPHLHWFPATTGAGGVVWELYYTITVAGDVEPLTESMATVTGATNEIAGENFYTTFGHITHDFAAKTTGIQISFTLVRNVSEAGDTYGAMAMAKTMGFHVTVSTSGSRDIDTP